MLDNRASDAKVEEHTRSSAALATLPRPLHMAPFFPRTQGRRHATAGWLPPEVARLIERPSP